jgi:hypothetical protein
MNRKIKFLLISALFISDQSFADNDPHRPVDKISHDLGIAPQQFRDCFEAVNPAPSGTRPSTERTHENKAILLPCLQKANPTITNEKLDAVMDKYRPGGHQAQEPGDR